MNKVVWMCWLQGWDTAPDICKICLESWKHYNPDWDIRAIDEKVLGDYINLKKYRSLTTIDKTALADLIRLDLLKEHGGIWIDSTAFCNQPLDEWLPELVQDTFVFYLDEPDKMCANWFIAAQEESYIVRRWSEESYLYQQRKANGYDIYNGEYRWAHRIFYDLYFSDPYFRELVDQIPKIDISHKDYSTNPPSQLDPGRHCHFFSPYRFGNNRLATDETRAMIDAKIHPLYKLSRKMPIDWDIDSTLMYLLNTIPHNG